MHTTDEAPLQNPGGASTHALLKLKKGKRTGAAAVGAKVDFSED